MSGIENITVELSDIVEEANLILAVEFVESFIEELAVKGVDPKVPAPPLKRRDMCSR